MEKQTSGALRVLIAEEQDADFQRLSGFLAELQNPAVVCLSLIHI